VFWRGAICRDILLAPTESVCETGKESRLRVHCKQRVRVAREATFVDERKMAGARRAVAVAVAITECVWRGDASLVSRDCSEAGCFSLGVECFTCTGHLATLSIYYDSLIEKCSTLSRPSVSSGVGAFYSSKLSVGAERANGVHCTTCS
jgi:hypothetical protein